ncbi:endonuclease domain-containing protein [Lentimicrobium sp. S6]|uniref:endonuclease domain-containing protein n=1 Tax=Lentimicrobium sp. S6 TaxID=2735872 RepID=UPI001C12F976|nr:endonuclease domain-containing protein [Lentimicrobium sp. S6]
MVRIKKNNKPMNFGANANTFLKAERLRDDMTQAEVILWERLKGKQILSLRFRRQHPIGQFIVDFYCHNAKLIIEVDGLIHQKKDVMEDDAGRTYELEKAGLMVKRFTNNEIENNIETVIESISIICQKRVIMDM